MGCAPWWYSLTSGRPRGSTKGPPGASATAMPRPAPSPALKTRWYLPFRAAAVGAQAARFVLQGTSAKSRIVPSFRHSTRSGEDHASKRVCLSKGAENVG